MWQPIETAPQDGRSIMLWISAGETRAHCFAPVSITAGGQWWDDSTGDQIKPIKEATHWMPLPEPPEQPND